MNTILSIKESHNTIKLIAQAGAKLDARIHIVALSGLSHWMNCGDNSILSSLVHAMPKSARGNALKFWISKHSANGLKWHSQAHEGKGGYKGQMPTLTDEEKQNILAQADAAPFYMKEDKEPSVFNDKASIIHLIKKLDSHIESLSPEGVAVLEYARGIMAKSA